MSSIDTSTLLSYYSAQTNQAATTAAAHTKTSSTTSSKSTSATANDVTPWTEKSGSQESRDADVLSLKSYIDASAVPLLAGSKTDTKMEQDNQKLFTLYNAVNNLSYLASIAKRDTTTDGQRSGYNTRFQAALAEIQTYVSDTDFNRLQLQAKESSSSVTSTATVAAPTFDYTGTVIATEDNVKSAVSGVSSSDSFKITVKKGSTTTDVAIDLSKVKGDLTMSNIVIYVNQQLAAGGFSTRFKKDLVSGTEDTTDKSKAQYALQVVPSGTEQVSLSATATPALYVSGTSGLSTTATETTTTAGKTTTTTTAADNQGRITKLSNLSNPTSEYSQTMSTTTDSGKATSTATATVVDASGNVYMLGNTTGDVGSQLNQGTQDAYLTKYDSAGKKIWSKLVGSAGTAEGASMALNPAGGVVVVGSTTAALSSKALNDGSQDSFAVKYDANGNQVWSTQIPTLNTNEANAVTVDSSGNVYIGGQTKGVIASGQTNAGKEDAYLAKIDSSGKVVYKQQFGTSGSDSVAATAMTTNGDLVVASIQDGHAILSKYAGGDATQAATWTMDMGELQYGGTIGSLVVKDDQIYISGTTRNGALNATATTSASGGTDAYVFSATDNGTSVTANHVTYVGTAGTDQGASLAVGSDGTVYLAGSTDNTFAGQSRSLKDTTNMFVAAVSSSGSVNWVKQYGGTDGQSTGTGIAFAETGASVLDALGLPSGSVSGQQNSDLAAATTLRAGDTFKVQIEGDAGRTFKITIDKGETLTSLVTKINAQFGSKGKASVTYASTGAALKLEVSSGVTAKLIAGDSNSDALGRLGIAVQTLAKAGTNTASSSSTTTSSTGTKTTYALGLSSNYDISTASGAGAVRAQLLNVLSAIQKAYQKSNATTSSASTTTGDNTPMSAAASTYYNNLNQNGSLGLSLLSA